MPWKRIRNHRRLYFLGGYLFLAFINIVILVLGIILIFRLLKYL